MSKRITDKTVEAAINSTKVKAEFGFTGEPLR